jgi:heme exporter protein C
MHARFANPARFLKIARPATAWLLGSGCCCVARGSAGLTVTPPDYLQGETSASSTSTCPPPGSAWPAGRRSPPRRSASSSGAIRSPRSPAARCAGGRDLRRHLPATGSIWGRPTWGTWWEWDGRLTSMLILFFLYLGYIALAAAERERGGEGRMAALFGLVGAINLPIIHYSVLWWRTLHQGQSISLTGDRRSRPNCCGRCR